MEEEGEGEPGARDGRVSVHLEFKVACMWLERKQIARNCVESH